MKERVTWAPLKYKFTRGTVPAVYVLVYVLGISNGCQMQKILLYKFGTRVYTVVALSFSSSYAPGMKNLTTSPVATYRTRSIYPNSQK